MCVIEKRPSTEFSGILRAVCTEEESTLEELYSNDGENKLEEKVDYQNVEDVLQGRHHTVKHRLYHKSMPHERRLIGHLVVHRQSINSKLMRYTIAYMCMIKDAH